MMTRGRRGLDDLGAGCSNADEQERWRRVLQLGWHGRPPLGKHGPLCKELGARWEPVQLRERDTPCQAMACRACAAGQPPYTVR